VPGLDGYFGQVAKAAGVAWTAPRVGKVSGDPQCAGGRQGPVAYCPDARTVEVDDEKALPRIHRDIGDYATGTLLAGRYGLSVLAAAGKPVDGPVAQQGAVCLAGSFTAAQFAAEASLLSPGDLDEAVQVLLDYDYVARDTAGAATAAGFDRVAAFRKGFLDGADECGLA
jgi:hypothetical protein